MTYVTPDDIAIAQEAKRLNAHLALSPGAIPEGSIPLLTGAPPLMPPIWQRTQQTAAQVPRGRTTASMLDENAWDPMPGTIPLYDRPGLP